METTRQQKISRLLQKEMSLYFQRHGSEYLGKMITVTSVRVTPDYGLAKIYVSIYPTTQNEEVMKLIDSENKNIRFEIAKIIKNQLRKIPEFHFYIDDSLDYADRIDSLLK